MAKQILRFTVQRQPEPVHPQFLNKFHGILFLCFLVLSAALFCTFALAQNQHPTLRTVREVNQISNIEARNAYHVQLEGVATYFDPEWGLLFVADDTGSIYVNIHGLNYTIPAGSRVHIDAVTGPGDVGTTLVQPSIHVMGQGVLPSPERRGLAELNTLKFDSHFIETQGVLSACDQPWARICFRITDGKVSALAVLPLPNNEAAATLVGTHVHVRGVSGVHLDSKGKPVSAMIFVNRIEDLQVDRGGPQNAFALAVIINTDNAVTNLSMAELREIYLGKRQYWKGAQKVVVLLPTGQSPAREAVLRLLQMDNSSFETYWSRKTGGQEAGISAVTVPSSGLAINLVSDTPGAIAIVPSVEVKNSVKVVKIDGHLPSESAYPFR